MNPQRKRRLLLILGALLALSATAGLVLFALSRNLQHFVSPSDIVAGKAQRDRFMRIGGVVLEGSTQRRQNQLGADFVVTDRFENLRVEFAGILPDLYREGQSVVAIGKLRADGVFVADEVLAKHDENYMPAEVKDAIERAKTQAGGEQP
jgi:cytochrome c-type biogenesis protein CcmE